MAKSSCCWTIYLLRIIKLQPRINEENTFYGATILASKYLFALGVLAVICCCWFGNFSFLKWSSQFSFAFTFVCIAPSSCCLFLLLIPIALSAGSHYNLFSLFFFYVFVILSFVWYVSRDNGCKTSFKRQDIVIIAGLLDKAVYYPHHHNHHHCCCYSQHCLGGRLLAQHCHHHRY